MRVLSLFDGTACGMIAMQLAGVEVESYDAYEIDKYAVKTAQHNFPMIQEHGDVFTADFTQYEGVDFLVGGSPCTYWSIAQTKNRETVASGMGWELFSQYVRALREAKPKYFIYENNKSMSKEIRASIDEAFGFEAVCINSALVSAQNRQRLYWVGKRNADGTYSKVNVEQPNDMGIKIADITENGETIMLHNLYGGFKETRPRVFTDKSPTIRTACGGGHLPSILLLGHSIPTTNEEGIKNSRKISVDECKRLQTVPEWYDFSCVSNSQAYKMLGNGWTCEVIKHLIQSCLNEKATDCDEQCRWF